MARAGSRGPRGAVAAPSTTAASLHPPSPAPSTQGLDSVNGAVGVLLPIALICAGYFAPDRGLWLSCCLELFVGMSAFIMLCSLGLIGIVKLLGTKMQPEGRKTPSAAHEAFESCRAMLVFASLAAWPCAQFRSGRPTALVFTLAEAQPWAPDSLPLYLVQLLLMTLVVDAYSYVKHALMHSKLLWRFHSTHHTFRDPSALASFGVHPVEAFLTFVPVLGMCYPGGPIWAHAYALWVVAWTLINLYLHCGYELSLVEAVCAPLFINTSGFHNSHHEMMFTNFGELLYLWDYLFDTGHHPRGWGRRKARLNWTAQRNGSA